MKRKYEKPRAEWTSFQIEDILTASSSYDTGIEEDTEGDAWENSYQFNNETPSNEL